ncbi:hypothetical protein PCANC_08059 [Puccinia coronata f. sp. avenae]|uniref:Uncharacterized protein n=1 Tax=Puccinia coronata f. sp. avenae TaxID=200324 RepID=A0A2N5V6V5_9BASI|nr:hypothetical protein PCANC_08059 [Puccinia coronata f. sp. avenae]
MGLLKVSSNRRLSLAKLRGSSSGMQPGRASPAPPQIITSTSNPSSSELHGNEGAKTLAEPGASHLALNIPPLDHSSPTTQQQQYSTQEQRKSPAAAAPRTYIDPQFPNFHAPNQSLEDSHLLGVHSLASNDRLRRARKAASHSDLHSASHVSGGSSLPNGLGPIPRVSRPNSIAPSLYSGAPPNSFKDLAVLYQVVAERRTAFDNLLWQVPATSLTAHAFLFSISLAADTGRFARIASMGLCIVITVFVPCPFTCSTPYFEERHQIDYFDRAHGDRWRDYRGKFYSIIIIIASFRSSSAAFKEHDEILTMRFKYFFSSKKWDNGLVGTGEAAQKPAGAGKLGWLAMHRSYPLWSKGMLIIGFLAVAILVLAIFHPSALLGYNCDLR